MESKFNVGDHVRILSWDEMKDLYETDENGDIYIPHDHNYFTRDMRDDRLCNIEANVTAVFDDGEDSFTYHLDTEDFGWTITEGMLELVSEQEPDIQEFQTDSFLNFVTCIKE